MDVIFRELQDAPTLNRNYPMNAGSIFWERSLFHRVKHTIIRFQTMDEMMTSDMGKAVSFLIKFVYEL